jgi:hypothetical protein
MTAGHFVHVAAAGGSRANAYMSRAGAVRPGYRVLLPVDGAFALRTVTKVITQCRHEARVQALCSNLHAGVRLSS